MKNEEIIKILDKINNYLCCKKYDEASKYIKRKKAELKNEKKSASDYMDELIKNLK